jgi:hypothetical protein
MEANVHGAEVARQADAGQGLPLLQVEEAGVDAWDPKQSFEDGYRHG